MRFYLIGPMDHDRESGKQWRDMMSEWLLSRHAIPINPYNKPMHKSHMDGLEDEDNYKLRKRLIKEGRFAEAREVTMPVVHTDLRAVDHADGLICHLDVEKKPCGTYDEMFTGAWQNKPIIIHNPHGVRTTPDWLFGRLPYQLFFDDWRDIKKYLDHINNDNDIDTLGKWKFFNFEPLIRSIIKDIDET